MFTWERDFPPLRTTIFPKLKKLWLDSAWYHDDETIANLSTAMAESFPDLEHLQTEACNLLELSKLGMLQKFPMYMSLNSLELFEDFYPDWVELLLQIPARLKKLVFNSLCLRSKGRLDEMPTIFYKLLKKHSPSLEELSVSFSWTADARSNGLDWKFPPLPAMKRLDICRNSLFRRIEFETSPGYFAGINYSVGFPAMESLQVSTNLNDFCPMDVFLPDEGEVVETVKKVQVSVSWREATRERNLMKAAEADWCGLTRRIR
ncbi:hypothetical protein Fcan01_26073 [Folsomia candida]|uniref:Uncharacterized protein n=1 Tax=Folsomia candida TaxID=158441 RepID=A0A226D0J9_FOLCA|nr:hypothetical protein Fcan01_26073 [Folsomia candida]